jgi:ABC-type oligopeptide transport system ATPase subunit
MLIEIKNISKYFSVKGGAFGGRKKSVHAVDDVSMTIEKGDSLSLVGESGCGKTTLARMMLRLLKPTQGEIVFDGEDISHLVGKRLDHYRRNVQMVFQDPYSSLDPRFTVRNIIKEGMHLAQGKYSSDQAKELRVQDMMKAIHLNQEMLIRYPHEFSGGERQRIAIARALSLNPKLLILDEAVSSLDVIIQQEIIELLKELQKRFELTYLFITHNLKVVKKISTKIAVMYKGKIVELAPAGEIFSNPLHSYTKELLSAALDYKTIERQEEIKVSPRARLIDRGNGHFVINE